MSRALGVSRQFFQSRSFSGVLLFPTATAQVQQETIRHSCRHHYGIRQIHLHNSRGLAESSRHSYPSILVTSRNSKTLFRSLTTSPTSSKKSKPHTGTTAKRARKSSDNTSLDGEKVGLSRRERKLSKITKGSSTLHEKTASLLTDRRPADRPLYVTKPSVSGKEMVRAIESSRVGAHRMKRHGNFVPAVGPISTNAPSGSGADPFDKGTDPFANQFEAAIEASIRGSGGSKKANTSGDRISPGGLPDVQAQYLVKPAVWESVNAKEIFVKNVTPANRPSVAPLEHGLDRVLFNPGVHWLQDPRSMVYNFDPYLRRICQPKDFDFDALPAYKTSSMDPQLLQIAHSNEAKYIGSTSSMTSILSQFYFLISGWKPLMTKHLSGDFANQPKGYTRLTRAPCTIQLVYKGQGVYAVDADKSFDSSTVLMQLGKSMEKMLTSTPQEFSRFTKENSWQVTAEEREQIEAFNYITTEKFLLRSQLDCEDPRLPGKTFDLKTRAAVAIRLDVQNYELNQGYQLRKTHGFLESFEREYYDMMRSAFLKYSLQVRIGQMDGIFVAYHNTARVFGFQYIPLEEMDSRLFGSSVMGDECFRNQLRLLSKTLDRITEKYPEQDLRITADTDDTLQSMNVWVETLPLGATTSADKKDSTPVIDENGVPQMQPGAELSLWQVVCYSNINDDQVVGPFNLKPDGTDLWDLRYKIGELNKPYMLNEYYRMRAQQAEIYISNDEQIAANAAAAAALAASEGDEEAVKAYLNKETQANRAAAKLDSMRSMLRRVSEKGRAKEEEEEIRNSAKAVVIWEPKGYVKVLDPLATSSALATVDETQDSDAPAPVSSTLLPKPAPVCYAVSAISDKMLAKLKSLNDPVQPAKPEVLVKESAPKETSKTEAGTESVAVPKEPVKVSSEDISNETSEVSRESSSSETPLCIEYRTVNGKPKKIALSDLELLRKSTREFIKNKDDQDRLGLVRKDHSYLASTITPFDDIRFMLAEIPYMEKDFAKLPRTHLERVASIMSVPIVRAPSKKSAKSNSNDSGDTMVAPFDSTKDLRQRVALMAPKFRYKLHLDFFYNYLSKYLTMRADAEPIKSLNDFMKIEDEEALERAAIGLSISKKAVVNPMRILGMDRKDALKKALLSQVYHSEQAFTDEELKKMGYLPRIFDPKEVKGSKDIMSVPNSIKKAKKKKRMAADSGDDAQTAQNTDEENEITPDNGSSAEKQDVISINDDGQDKSSFGSESDGSSLGDISLENNNSSSVEFNDKPSTP